jgi:tetratricopeptide (TPR) repeat protein
LGSALAHQPDHLPEAVKEFRAALQIRPEYAQAHFYLALALSREPGRLNDVITEYEEAPAN